MFFTSYFYLWMNEMTIHFFQAMADKHGQAVELLAELRKTKENIERKSGKVKPDVLYSLLQVRFFTIMLVTQIKLTTLINNNSSQIYPLNT